MSNGYVLTYRQRTGVERHVYFQSVQGALATARLCILLGDVVTSIVGRDGAVINMRQLANDLGMETTIWEWRQRSGNGDNDLGMETCTCGS